MGRGRGGRGGASAGRGNGDRGGRRGGGRQQPRDAERDNRGHDGRRGDSRDDRSAAGGGRGRSGADEGKGRGKQPKRPLFKDYVSVHPPSTAPSRRIVEGSREAYTHARGISLPARQMDPAEIERLEADGRIHRGRIRINPKNFEQGYVPGDKRASCGALSPPHLTSPHCIPIHGCLFLAKRHFGS